MVLRRKPLKQISFRPVRRRPAQPDFKSGYPHGQMLVEDFGQTLVQPRFHGIRQTKQQQVFFDAQHMGRIPFQQLKNRRCVREPLYVNGFAEQLHHPHLPAALPGEVVSIGHAVLNQRRAQHHHPHDRVGPGRPLPAQQRFGVGREPAAHPPFGPQSQPHQQPEQQQRTNARGPPNPQRSSRSERAATGGHPPGDEDDYQTVLSAGPTQQQTFGVEGRHQQHPVAGPQSVVGQCASDSANNLVGFFVAEGAVVLQINQGGAVARGRAASVGPECLRRSGS